MPCWFKDCAGESIGPCQYYNCGVHSCKEHGTKCPGCGLIFHGTHIIDHLANSPACDETAHALQQKNQQYEKRVSETKKPLLEDDDEEGSELSCWADLCHNRPQGMCEFPECSALTCLRHGEYCPGCGDLFCKRHIAHHREISPGCAPQSTTAQGEIISTTSRTPKSMSSSITTLDTASDQPEPSTISTPESDAAVIDPPKFLKDDKPWKISLKVLGEMMPGAGSLESGSGHLRLSVYHDCIWVTEEYLPLLASRHVESIRKHGTAVFTMQSFEDALKSEKTLFPAYQHVCAGWNVFMLRDGASPYMRRAWQLIQGALKNEGVLSTCFGSPDLWNVPMISQLTLILKHVHGNLAYRDGPVELAEMCLTGHNRGNDVFANAKLIPDTLGWNLCKIIQKYQSGKNRNLWMTMAGCWIGIAELLKAWRSGFIGCRSAYLRLEKIDELVKNTSEHLKGLTLSEFLTSSNTNSPDCILADELAAMVQDARRWVSQCRQRLNRVLRLAIFNLEPCGHGGRWDVVKDDCEPPVICPFIKKIEIKKGGSAMEAHTAAQMMLLGGRFSKMKRYEVYAGPTQEEIAPFREYQKTLRAKAAKNPQCENLIAWIGKNQPKWIQFLKQLDQDRIDSEERRRDIRGFSSESADAAEKLFQTCPDEMRPLLKEIFKVSGSGGIKDAEYWDENGLPWDQKTMFDPFNITGLSFEKAVGDVVSAVKDQVGDADNGKISYANGTVCYRMGIVLDCTYVGLRLYEVVWSKLYENFDLGEIPYLDEKKKPLIIDVISQVASHIVTPMKALAQRGVCGILFEFNQLLKNQQLPLQSLVTFCKRFCDIPDVKVYLKERLPRSWTWYRDYQDELPATGWYCEIGVKYDKFESIVARLLVNPVKRRIMFCPLHYNRYVVPDSPTSITGTALPHLFAVDIPTDEADAFWLSILK